jgi:hypothetical protein
MNEPKLYTDEEFNAIHQKYYYRHLPVYESCHDKKYAQMLADEQATNDTYRELESVPYQEAKK